MTTLDMRYYIRLWDWRLVAFIFLFLGLPNVYQLYRVRLIGNELPDLGSLAIVSQWQFVGLVVEVFQEATVLAIFFFLGSQIRSRQTIQTDRTKSVITFIFVADQLVFSVGCISVPRRLHHAHRDIAGRFRSRTRAFLGISIWASIQAFSGPLSCSPSLCCSSPSACGGSWGSWRWSISRCRIRL